MCQAVVNTCPGRPKGSRQHGLFVSRCGLTDFAGAGLGLGHGIVIIVPIVITVVAVFQALFFFALGRDLKGISANAVISSRARLDSTSS
jgi:hypothetical protein